MDAALGQVLDAESAHYITLWEELSAHQRLLLLALADEAGAVYSEEYRRTHRLGAATSVQRSVSRLTDREWIEQDKSGAYAINDVFFRAWIATRAR